MNARVSLEQSFTDHARQSSAPAPVPESANGLLPAFPDLPDLPDLLAELQHCAALNKPFGKPLSPQQCRALAEVLMNASCTDLDPHSKGPGLCQEAMALVAADQQVQAAGARLRKHFLNYAAAVALDAKRPSELTRASERRTEAALQEAIEVELIGMRKTGRADSSHCLEIPASLSETT